MLIRISERYQLLPGRDFSIGRRDCDIVINGDQSISRKHAVLSIQFSSDQKEQHIILKDVSKFGTSVGSVRLSGSEILIKHNEQVTFGTADSIYDVTWEQFIMTTSSLDSTVRRELKAVAASVGATIVNEWQNNCQLVVMSSLTVTVKVICALLAQKPIVTIQYLKDYFSAITSGKPLPEAINYLPPLAESQVDSSKVCFKPNRARSQLFKNKRFIFFSNKQCKKLSQAIELGGGIAQVLSLKDNLSQVESVLLQPNTCVMNCDATDEDSSSISQSDWLARLFQIIQQNKRRLISDSEIGFAVLYCSTDHYCNPLSISDSQPKPATVVSQFQPQPSQASTSKISNQPITNVEQSATIMPSLVSRCSNIFNLNEQTVSTKKQVAQEIITVSKTVPEESIQCVYDSQPGARQSPVKAAAAAAEDSAEDVKPSTSALKLCSNKRLNESLQAAVKLLKPIENNEKINNLKTEIVGEMESSSGKKSTLPRVKQESKQSDDIWDFPKSVGRNRFAKNSSIQVKAETSVQLNTESEQINQTVSSSTSIGNVMDKFSAESTNLKKQQVESNILDTRQDTKSFQITTAKRIVNCSEGQFFTVNKIKEDIYVNAEDDVVRTGKMICEERALIASNRAYPRQYECIPKTNGHGVVKNFKKFHKVKGKLPFSLPTIIGGRDLVVSETSASQTIENMFHDQIMNDRQQSAANRLADDMFSWEPSKKKGRH